MNTKKRSLSLLAVSSLGLIFGYLVLQTELQASAAGDALIKTGTILVYGCGALACVFLLLSVVHEAFSSWKKFAIWFVPLAALLFVFYPVPGSGDLFAPDPEQIYQWVSVAYVLISLGIILRHVLSRRS